MATTIFDELRKQRPPVNEGPQAAPSPEKPQTIFDSLRAQRPQPTPQPAPERTALGNIKDTGVSLAKGVVGTGQAVVGLGNLATGGKVGEVSDKLGLDFEGWNESLSEQYSPAQQIANRKVDDAEGFLGTAKTMIENPSTIGHALVETAPLVVAGGGIGAGLRTAGTKLVPKLASKFAPQTLGMVAGASGEGAISAGLASEQVRNDTEDRTLTGKQALQSTAAGIGTGIFGLVGGRLAQKFGFADVDTMLAGSALNVAKKGGVKEIAKRIAGGGITEGVFEELPQSIQEQMWQNAALDKPLMEGVPEGAAQSILVGGAMGSGANLLPSRKSKGKDDLDTIVGETSEKWNELDDNVGDDPLGQAVNKSVQEALGDLTGKAQEKFDEGSSVSDEQRETLTNELTNKTTEQPDTTDNTDIISDKYSDKADVVDQSFLRNDLLYDIAGSEQDVQGQADTRGRKVAFNKLLKESKENPEEGELSSTEGRILQFVGKNNKLPRARPSQDSKANAAVASLLEKGLMKKNEDGSYEKIDQTVADESPQQPKAEPVVDNETTTSTVVDSKTENTIHKPQELNEERKGDVQKQSKTIKNDTSLLESIENDENDQKTMDSIESNKSKSEAVDNTESIVHGQEINTNPSEAQKEAENYKTAKVNMDGLKLSIENPAGSTRSGTDPSGKEWSREMANDYGRVLGSKGYDKDHVDIFVAPGYQGGAKHGYVINQHNKDGSFDEHKTVVGVNNEQEALELYNSNYEEGWTGGKSVTRMSLASFKKWVVGTGPARGELKRARTVSVEQTGTGDGKSQVTDNIENQQPNNIIEHTTKREKILKGIVRTDLTRAEAKAIDQFTFKKDGGFFIREKHLEADNVTEKLAASAMNAVRASSLYAAEEKGLKPISDKSDGEKPKIDEKAESKDKPVVDNKITTKPVVSHRVENIDNKTVPEGLQAEDKAGKEEVKQPLTSKKPDLKSVKEQEQREITSKGSKTALKDGEAKEPIENVGEKLHGSRADIAALRESLSEKLSEKDIRSKPLSKIWPKPKMENLDNSFASAFAVAARAEIPNKPRQRWKLDRWVKKVKELREFAQKVANGDISPKIAEAKLKEVSTLSAFSDKIEMYQAIDKDLWYKIKNIGNAPDAIRYGKRGKDGLSEQIPTPFASVNGKSYRYKKSFLEILPDIEKDLQGETDKPRMKFEIRGREGTGYFINKKGDSEYRHLKDFDNLKEARAYQRGNYKDLVQAWEDVKARDNVRKTDTRKRENLPRTGENYRKGKDVDAETFMKTFGFRGVEFGKWVSQGKGKKDRQGMLNAAYDALFDLAGILNIPPEAISLNGTLGLGFGSRGHGWASAHYEPGTLVINLTKPRGAGSLAHEWFHALDNYFQMERGDATGDAGFITYQPETIYRHKSTGQTFTESRFKRIVPDNLQDWEKVEGVRPEVSERFVELVKRLDDSGMNRRSRILDKGKRGYWSSIIERAARAFESYAISKMQDDGYSNDYLANVVSLEDFGKNEARYPYLTEEELAPVKEAFDGLFSEIKTKKTDKGVALFSKALESGDFTTLPGGAKLSVADESILQHNLRENDDQRESAEALSRTLSGQEVTPYHLPDTLLGKDKKGRDDLGGRAENPVVLTENLARIFGKEVVWATIGEKFEQHGVVVLNSPKVTDKIFLDIRSPFPAHVVFGHELSHHLKQDSPEIFDALYQATYHFIRDVEQYRIEKGFQGYSKRELREEIIGDLLGDNFNNPEFWQEVKANSGGKFRQIVNKILAWIDGVLKKISGEEVFNSSQFVTDVEAARSILAKAVAEYQKENNAFKKWQGNSKIKDIVYHGSPTFGQDDDSFTFQDKPASNTGSPMAGFGFFFTEDRTEAQGYTKGSGKVEPVYLRIENPIEHNSWDVPQFNDQAEAKAFAKRKQLQGHDGIFIKDQRHWIAFDSNQVKSADKNTGEYSLTNPDIRYSKAVQAYNDTEQEVIGSFTEIFKNADMSIGEKLLSTMEYISQRTGATRRMFQAQLDRRDDKYQLEERILRDFVPLMEKAKKESEAIYNRANKYLLAIDRTGKAFKTKRENSWEVTTPEDESVGYAETKIQAYEMARDAWKISGKKGLIKDYGIEKAERFHVINPKGKTIAITTNEKAAEDFAIQAEQEKLNKRGMPAEARSLVKSFREMTNRAFNEQVADYRRILDEAEEAGLDEPTVEMVDESKRWGLFKGSEKIADFETKEDAQQAGGRSHTVRRQADSEIRKELKLSEVIAEMGDLRGAYFPRQRQSGAVILRATHPEERPFMKKYDFYFTEDQSVDQEGVVRKKPISRWLKKRFNDATGRLPYVETLEKEARRLKKLGYEVTVGRDTSTPEAVFDAVKLVASVNALMSEALIKSNKDKDRSASAAKEINQILTANIADIFKSRGYLSSRIARSENYVEGFETDMLMAGTQYARGLSAGFAKKNAARKMAAAITGRDVSFGAFKTENEMEGPDAWEEYVKFVDERRLDPKEQPKLYEEAMKWMGEVLRNDEQVDRIMGTLKGLAVIKFLGFRVSSAAVNATNMFQGVPATISSHTGSSIPESMKAVTNAANKYGKHRTGKGNISAEDKAIFLEITDRGWDDAQFNTENAAVLQSKVGKNWNTFNEYAMKMFGAVEKFNRSASIFAAYKEYRKNTDLSHEEAMLKAKHTSDRAHGVYGKATMPAWTRGAANPLKLTYTFQKFMHNYILNMTEMGLKGDHKAAAYMLLSPAVIAGAGATAATPILAAFASVLGIGGDDPEEELYKWAEETFGSDRLARHGLAGLAGVNLKGSLQMNNPMPRSLKEVFGAPQAIYTDTVKGAKHLAKGELYKGAEALLPTAFGSAFKAIRESTEGISTGSYSPVFYGDEPLKADGIDATLRFLSFNPARISGIREKQWREKKIAKKFQERRNAINTLIKRRYIYGKGNVSEIYKEISRYNELVRGSGRRDLRVINPRRQIKRIVRRARRPNRTERLRQNA